MRAREWTGNRSPAGWFMSEKFDGWRVCWDGRRLVCENMTLNPPDWFVDGLPKNIPLDAEIWGGYHSFESVGRTLRSPVASHTDWRGLSLRVIDVYRGCDFFKDTHPELARTPMGGFAAVIPQTICESARHLDSLLAEIVSRGGEGVVLRHPYSIYEAIDSPSLRKVKPAHDAEGVVVGHREGKQSLRLRLDSGGEFFLAANVPVKVGERITFRHFGFFESGKPREPRFLRVRPQLIAA